MLASYLRCDSVRLCLQRRGGGGAGVVTRWIDLWPSARNQGLGVASRVKICRARTPDHRA